MTCASLLLWSLAIATGGWQTLPVNQLWLLALSGVIGILIGDTALFAAMNRLGPRRAGVLFATHALFSALLAYWFLGETIWGWTLVGCGLLVTGVMTAILFGKRACEQHHWEAGSHELGIGIALGLLSALCQAVFDFNVKTINGNRH